jgi:MFS family permease
MPPDHPPAPVKAATRLGIAGADLRLLGFGFLLCFGSSIGQTFFIAQFNAAFRAELGLSHGELGLLYSLATLASGVTMIWLGARLDHSRLRPFALAVVLGLAAAASLVALAPGWTTLGLAFFALRLAGQGLMTHISVTSMVRYFDAMRGRAVAIASLGFPAGEIVLPGLCVLLLGLLPWRTLWWGAAAILLLLVAPLVLRLLADQDARHAAWLESRPERQRAPPRGGRLAALRDRRFLLTLPATFAPGFITTWVFFHQVELVSSRGWERGWFATCIAAYAVASVTAALAAGWLTDRLRAVRLLPLYLLPLIAGCAVLGILTHPAAAMLGLVLVGMSGGAGAIVLPSGWAELLGVERIATVRALGAATMVLASAASPGMVGVLIDRGIDLGWVALGSAAATLAAIGLLLLIPRHDAAPERS